MPFSTTTYEARVAQAVADCRAAATQRSRDLYNTWASHITTLDKVHSRFIELCAGDPCKAEYVRNFEFDHMNADRNYTS